MKERSGRGYLGRSASDLLASLQSRFCLCKVPAARALLQYNKAAAR